MLDVFSGRPNPTWTLTPFQVEELRGLLAASRQEQRGEAVEPPYLGYAGFVITSRGQESSMPFRVRVYGGVLTFFPEQREGSTQAYYADTYGVEAWLLEQAVRQGYADAIERMGGPRLQSGEQRSPHR